MVLAACALNEPSRPCVRVLVEEENAEAAAEDLDALGPVFRAKKRV